MLGLFGYAVGALEAFMYSPYGLVADVKMLNFFRFMGATGAIVIAALLLLSILIKNFWRRYLCPYGALMGLGALFSPVWIRRLPRSFPCS